MSLRFNCLATPPRSNALAARCATFASQMGCLRVRTHSRKLPEWLVLRWADELLDGLEYLHSQNPPIIHRDVKPSNLKPRQDETLVLVDFGIAKEFVPGMDTLPGASAVGSTSPA